MRVNLNQLGQINYNGDCWPKIYPPKKNHLNIGQISASQTMVLAPINTKMNGNWNIKAAHILYYIIENIII